MTGTGAFGHHSFDHTVAQELELEHTRNWLRENGGWVWKAVESSQNGTRYVHDLILGEFFAGDRKLWDVFSRSLDGKTVLDIGTGPVSQTAMWPYAGRRFVIDPLALEYDRLSRQMFGKSFFDGITMIAAEAEDWVSDLKGAISGAIVCRNCLDHCREPYLILSNISSYAAPGCALILWTDLYHLQGHDEAHTDITRDREGFRRLVENLGFDIHRETPIATGRETVQFGCFGVKR